MLVNETICMAEWVNFVRQQGDCFTINRYRWVKSIVIVFGPVRIRKGVIRGSPAGDGLQFLWVIVCIEYLIIALTSQCTNHSRIAFNGNVGEPGTVPHRSETEIMV